MWILFVPYLINFFLAVNCQTFPPPCTSQIYCYGQLLDTVQRSRVFDDSKTFVDMKMINAEADILSNFDTLMTSTGGSPTKEQVEQFVTENFEAGNELEDWVPTDYDPAPGFINEIGNATVKQFATDLVAIWPFLAKKVKAEVSQNQDRYSLLPIPNGFIIPGGRFREYYYWDSYWIIKGLLVCGMGDTARGMIENFFSLVETYGFIPNGGRVYYRNRSQPPLLTSMVYDYQLYYPDGQWLGGIIQNLDRELSFWLDNRMEYIDVDGNSYMVFHYKAESSGPRPESYVEDVATTEMFTDAARREQAYADLKSGAESGWDFSSRWIFDEDGGNQANLSFIQTRRVVPVDLNAYLCRSFNDLSQLYLQTGDSLNAQFWAYQATEIQTSIQNLLWNDGDGIWYDYDLDMGRSRKNFHPSGLTPLWARCYDMFEGPTIGGRVMDYLNDNNIFDYLGGVPTSLQETGEQWDLPNAWPPLQDIVVEGLRNTDNTDAVAAAKTLAERWVSANIIGFKNTGSMFEKYDAVNPGQYGGGGEYPVQKGFGWSNGVALTFINDYFRSANKENNYVR